MNDVLVRYNQKLSFYAETKEIFQKDYPDFAIKN